MSPQPRKKQMPGTLVLNWQSLETPATKPVVRRPMTACEACRSAKVKCGGQQTCERCRTRGLRCVYTVPPKSQNGAEIGISSKNQAVGRQSPSNLRRSDDQAIPAASPAMYETTIDSMSIDPTNDRLSTSDSCLSEISSNQTAARVEQLGEGTSNYALKQYDWVFSESDFSLNSGHDPGQNSLDILPNANEGTSSITNGGYNAVSEPPRTETSSSLPSMPARSLRCQCRVNMMTQVPEIEAAILELPRPKLDDMFKVTGDVIRSCQEFARCSCPKGPVDLVCMMTVFEQTAFCFDYIAKSGFGGTVKVGIGTYSVSLINDASLKRMLVLDLVNQANELLDSVSNLAHGIVVAQNDPRIKCIGRTPACLRQLNMDYVQEATAGFKKLLCLVTDFFGENNA